MALLALPGMAQATDHEGLKVVWDAVRRSGTYRFTADVRQRMLPVPSVTTVGRQSREDALYMEGDTDLQARRLHLTVWSQGGSVLDPNSGAEMVIEADRARARRGTQPWEENPGLCRRHRSRRRFPGLPGGRQKCAGSRRHRASR